MRGRKRRAAALLAAILTALLLSGCTRECSFCGRRSVFYDQCRIHGRETVVCPFCQVW